MKNSQKSHNLSTNLDTAPQKNGTELKIIGSETTCKTENDLGNCAINEQSTAASQEKASKSQNCEENNTYFRENSLISTVNSAENENFSTGANLDTSTKIVDPLSKLDYQKSDDSNMESSGYEDEILVFSKLFPNVSVEKLQRDRLFGLFSSHNEKKLTISELYTNYLTLFGALEEDFNRKALISLQNKLSTPGSLASSEKSKEIFFTREQVLKMTPKEINKYYNIIRDSQQKW